MDSKGLALARTAAVAYTGTFLAGSALSIRRNYPARALGIHTGDDVRKNVFVGVTGAGLAPPWNMIVQMWAALTLAKRPGMTGRRARAVLAFLSAIFVAGHVAEPISHRIVTNELPVPDAAVAVAGMAIPMVMLTGALKSLVEGEQQ